METEEEVVAAKEIAVPPSKLKLRRLELGLYQQAVSDAVQGRVTRDGLSRLESGEAWPTAPQIVALARFYGVETHVIFDECTEAWYAFHDEAQPRPELRS